MAQCHATQRMNKYIKFKKYIYLVSFISVHSVASLIEVSNYRFYIKIRMTNKNQA